MDNGKKIILDLFGGTGSWSKPYAAAGYDVRIITLPHLPLFENKPGDVRDYDPPTNVYGILADPGLIGVAVKHTKFGTDRGR